MSSFTNKFSAVRSIAFDLDDTLIDTTGKLVPMAAQNACQCMINQGLNTDLKTCIQTRTQLLKNFEAHDIFTELVKTFNQNELKNSDIEKIAQSGFEVFYNPDVPASLPLIDNSMDILTQLQKKYTLHLVTAGIPQTQKKKVEAAQIAHLFKTIQYVDISQNQNKGQAFEKIIKIDHLASNQLLCVGNRLTDEIFYAEQLNCPSCLFLFGEHQAETLSHTEIHPDLIIHNLKELIQDLGL